MPQEGAPRTLAQRIAAGREAIVARLALGVPASEDPELVAHMLSAYADEAARLTLTEPGRYPPERILRLTRWTLERLAL
jgi:hypothetical protein